MNTDAFHYYTRLEKVKCFVEENYPEEISLQEAANVACMERTSFSRFFGNKVGVSFTQWLRRIRIAKAKELMKRNNLSIMEVTYAVGFSNLRTFERVFKQLTEVTPSQFKKAVRPS